MAFKDFKFQFPAVWILLVQLSVCRIKPIKFQQVCPDLRVVLLQREPQGRKYWIGSVSERKL